jgi:hypothetical protein
LAAALNVATQIGASAGLYQLDQVQVSAFVALQTAFATAYQTAYDPITRTRAAVLEKNEKKELLLVGMRSLCGMIQANVEVPESAKVNLGLSPRKPPTPAPVPGKATVDIEKVENTVVTLRVHGEDPSHRGRPAGVSGITIFSHIGSSAPINPADWTFVTSTGKMVVTVPFPPETPMGTKVWFTAFFFNSVKASGTAATAVSTLLFGSNTTAQAA